MFPIMDQNNFIYLIDAILKQGTLFNNNIFGWYIFADGI